MGFFDRFKKKQTEHSLHGQSTDFSKEPWILEHSDGRGDKICFFDVRIVDGKKLKPITIQSPGDEVPSTYFMEPIFDHDEHGKEIDVTEQYYKNLVASGDRAALNAVKGFFQPKDITKEKIGSDYIGRPCI